MREDKIYKGEFVSIFREENNYGYMAMIKISKEGDQPVYANSKREGKILAYAFIT